MTDIGDLEEVIIWVPQKGKAFFKFENFKAREKKRE